jgi:carbon monoxide dehydrogenase subunit G
MPGCEKLELVDGHYVGEIKVKVGPIQGNFTGKVDLKDKVEPESYTMIVDGRGAPGFVKATALVKLAAEGDATRVSYDCDAQIGGKIASVGQRLLEASARAIVAQSLAGLHTNIKLRAAAHREPAKPTTEPAKSEPAKAASEPAKSEPAKAASEPARSASEPAKSEPAKSEPAKPEPAKAASEPARSEPASASAPGTPAAPAVAFTPVKVKQSALANAVAKEVASTLFPRSVLVGIILIQAAVIIWLLVR